MTTLSSSVYMNERERRFRSGLAQRMRAARITTWGPVQERCAEALHLSQSQISRWERGQEPRLFDLVRFARACNRTVDELLGSEALPPLSEQLLLGLDHQSATVVVELVQLLKHKRRA
jgi:transcriptional regulator with XRE-family HTH domain